MESAGHFGALKFCYKSYFGEAFVKQGQNHLAGPLSHHDVVNQTKPQFWLEHCICNATEKLFCIGWYKMPESGCHLTAQWASLDDLVFCCGPQRFCNIAASRYRVKIILFIQLSYNEIQKWNKSVLSWHSSPSVQHNKSNYISRAIVSFSLNIKDP